MRAVKIAKSMRLQALVLILDFHHGPLSVPTPLALRQAGSVEEKVLDSLSG